MLNLLKCEFGGYTQVELLFLEETITLDHQITATEVIEKIQNLLGSKYYYSHLVVDGVEIYEDLLFYLENHMKEIKRMEVIAKTPRSFVNDLLLTAETYIKGAKPEIDVLIESFYQNPSGDNWSQFAHLLEGIQWLNQMIMLVDRTKVQPQNWGSFIKKATSIEEVLKHLEDAVENKDSILIADMIQYEILPFMQALGEEIQQIIDTEGYRYDLN